MQPRTLTLFIIIVPLFTSNAVYLLSAYEGFVPWCNPYIDGCTTISRAARSGNAIFLFRATMIAYAVLLIWFWLYTKHWLDLLHGHKTRVARIILWLGVIGAIFLIIYVDYLGTSGEVNRFMRRYGILIFFTFTPLAQLLLLQQHINLSTSGPDEIKKRVAINPRVLNYQFIILLLMLIIGIVSLILDVAQLKTYETENIVEWNFSLLLNAYFIGLFFIWKHYNYYLKNDKSSL